MSSTVRVLNTSGAPIFLNLNNPIVARACLNVENAKLFEALPNTVTQRSKTREKMRTRVKQTQTKNEISKPKK